MKKPFIAPNFCQEHSLKVSHELSQIFTHRRTIREFSREVPDIRILKNAIGVARYSPSGANKQPWSFCLIQSTKIKEQIRKLAEIEEERFYIEKPNQKWLEDLKHLNLDSKKEFLTEAPYLIIIFHKHFDRAQNGEKTINYYAKESAGIATGMLISALHMSGLSTLTYTPKRMQFLGPLLNRPSEERPFMILGVGLSHQDAMVPIISKKTTEEVLHTFI